MRPCNILGVLEILSSDVASFSSEMLDTLIAYLSRWTGMLAWRTQAGCSSCFERPTGEWHIPFPLLPDGLPDLFRRSLINFVEFPEKWIFFQSCCISVVSAHINRRTPAEYNGQYLFDADITSVGPTFLCWDRKIMFPIMDEIFVDLVDADRRNCPHEWSPVAPRHLLTNGILESPRHILTANIRGLMPGFV